MFRSTDVIEVRIWGRTVGALAAGGVRGSYDFEFDGAWLRDGLELAPIIMPRSSLIQRFPDLPRETFQGLPPTIADSLPDRFGNRLIDAWMARENVTQSQITALDRLAYMGNRALGAVEFSPSRGPREEPPSILDIRELVRVARETVQGRVLLEVESEDALRQIISVGTSAGGARAKAIIHLNEVTGEVLSGQSDPPPGFEPWLLKFDGVGEDRQLGAGQDYGRVEHAYSQMARAAGVHMAQTQLLKENGRAHFLTKRFDRVHAQKLHMQSLCAMMALDFNAIELNDYAQYQLAVDELGLGGEAKAEAFRRMVFNVAAANCDDHTKNLSFLMDETGSWSLSPAYDVTHAYNPEGQWTYQHLMGVDGKFDEITRRDLVTFAEKHDVEGATTIVRRVVEAVENWPEYAEEAGLEPDRTAAIGHDQQAAIARL